MRLQRITIVLALCAPVVLSLVAASSHAPAAASDPTNPAGLDFSMGIDADGDTSDDCDTSGGPAECGGIPFAGAFRLSAYLDSLPDKLETYEGFDIVLTYDGVASQDNADIETYWPECAFPASSYQPGRAAFGCAYFPEETEASSYTGRIATLDFTCDEPGSIVMQGTPGGTSLASELSTYLEGADETLVVSCGAPAPTPVPTPSVLIGDVTCDGVINAIDAALVLQHVVGRLPSLACEEAAHVNGDGVINPLDALLILQFDARLIDSLPP